MQRYIMLLGLLTALLIGASLAFSSAFQDVRADATPPPRPPCYTHTAGMTLTTSSLAPNVGEHLLVTVTLGNEGCSMIGLPKYDLYLQQAPYTLAPEQPDAIIHYLGLDPGETDTVTFTLDAIGVGTVALRASASFEVHLGYPGPAYWASAAAGPVTVTVPTTDTEVVVLQQAAYALGCFPSIEQHETNYWFDCPIAAGHAIDARIERFVDDATAQATFAARQGTLQLEPFHCYPANTWMDELSTLMQWHYGHRWLAGRWIITAHSVDDTAIPVEPSPALISEAVLRAALRNHLFLGCHRQYLPLVCKLQGVD